MKAVADGGKHEGASATRPALFDKAQPATWDAYEVWLARIRQPRIQAVGRRADVVTAPSSAPRD